MKFKDKRINTTGIIFTLLIILVCLGLMFYNDYLEVKLHTSTETALVEVLEQQKFNFTSGLEAKINTIKSMAILLSHMPNDQQSVELFMREALEQCSFDEIMLINTNKMGIREDGTIVNIDDNDYIKRALAGETVIVEPRISDNAGKIVSILTPVNYNGKINGVLACSYSVGRLDDLLMPSFGGKGYAFVVNRDGDVVAKTNNEYILLTGDNIYETLDNANITKYDSIDTMRQRISSKKNGRMEYTIGKEIRHAHYQPMEISDWSLFSVVPDEVVVDNARDIMIGAIIVTFSVVAAFIGFMIYLLYLQKKTNEERAVHTTELEKSAYYDELTGIPNMNKFKIDATSIMRNNPDKTFVAVKIDIVNFKMLNEMLGFEAADKAICSMSDFIMAVREDMDIDVGCVARVTADEFILLDEANNAEETYERIEKFEDGYNGVSKKFLGGYKAKFRYGRCMVSSSTENINDVIEKVNLAHRTAKKLNLTVYDYNDEIRAQHVREAELESMMSESIEKGEFKVYLQPKYQLSDETVVGAEALVRWQTKDGNIIYPDDFIPLFERSGSIVSIDMYMFEQVCKIISGWIKCGINPIPVSVNFSKIHLQNENFVRDISQIADKHNTPKEYLEVELTESSIYDNEKVLQEFLGRLHESGFTLSMDDFGSGYSSLGLLKNLPVDTIKIDKGFFSDIIYEKRAKTVIESVIDMAKKLCIDTVAEGVETKEHIDLLKEIGCDIVQGYYYAKPMPASEFSENTDWSLCSH